MLRQQDKYTLIKEFFESKEKVKKRFSYNGLAIEI
jgi:hypothetical protein